MLADWFHQLDQQLAQYQGWWQLQPMRAGWPADLPAELTQRLRALTLQQCADIDRDPQLQAQLFGAFFAELWAALPPLAPQPIATAALPFWLSTDIGGRKWQQICQLVQAATDWQQPALPALEWCAGKGHLGLLYSYRTQQPVLSLEWQQALCQQGEQKAQRLNLPQRFVCVDVLQQPTTAHFQHAQHLLALHACGDLHRQAIKQAAEARLPALSVVPCCYHLQQATVYQPWSVPGRASRLRLDKPALRLAVQQSCTGGARVQRLSQTEMLWRQLWWQWRRQQGLPYQPLRSVGKHWFSAELPVTEALRQFIDFAAAEHQLAAPAAAQLPALLAQAEQALLQQRQLEVLQHLFRRPLELWLVLDLALYLQEQGYQVALQQLCEQALTPRNLLVQARLPADAQDT